MRYDVIIRAGSASCALATRLSEDLARSALLLEAGPEYPEFDRLPEDLKWRGNFLMSAFGSRNLGDIVTATFQPPNPIPVPRGKATGGSGAIIAQFILRGIPEETVG